MKEETLIHRLKTIPPFFEHVYSGQKTFELRKNDRAFNVGDWLELREYDPETEKYTCRSIYKKIGYILKGGQFGIQEGYVILGFLDIFNLLQTKDEALRRLHPLWSEGYHEGMYDGLNK